MIALIALLVFAGLVALWWLAAAAADYHAAGRRPLKRITQPVRAAVPALPSRIRCDLARARAARARAARARAARARAARARRARTRTTT